MSLIVQSEYEAHGTNPRLHAMSSSLDHSATAFRLFQSASDGTLSELVFGSSGQVVTSAGTTSPVVFATPAAVHTQLHAMSSTLDHSATARRLFVGSSLGTVAELAFGSTGQVLTAHGSTAALTFETPSGGSTLTPANSSFIYFMG